MASIATPTCIAITTLEFANMGRQLVNTLGQGRKRINTLITWHSTFDTLGSNKTRSRRNRRGTFLFNRLKGRLNMIHGKLDTQPKHDVTLGSVTGIQASTCEGPNGQQQVMKLHTGIIELLTSGPHLIAKITNVLVTCDAIR